MVYDPPHDPCKPQRPEYFAGFAGDITLGVTVNLDALPWTLIEARNDEGTILVRHRQFPDGFPKEQFPHRLNIFWQILDASPSGFPDTAESDRMSVFEDRLVDATELEKGAVLSMVLTGNGQREYVFHTRSTDQFVRRLAEMPQETERYPIEIHCAEDVAWEYVDRVLGDFTC